MKKLLFISIAYFFAGNILLAQTKNLSEINLNEVNLDKEFINDNSLENFSGEFKIQDGQLVFIPNDC